MTLDLGYRYSDYTTDINTDTYKYAGTWTIDNQLKLRASYQRAVRAPNIVELYGPVTGNLFAMGNDPCNKAAPGDALSVNGYTFDQCARTGVTQAVWDNGGPANSNADQYNTVIGGNLDLDPESSDTYSYGFILSPNFLDELHADRRLLRHQSRGRDYVGERRDDADRMHHRQRCRMCGGAP